MILVYLGLLLAAQEPVESASDDTTQILALCDQGDSACDSPETNVGMFDEVAIHGILATEGYTVCRTTRASAAELIDRTVRRVVQAANFAIRYADATETVVVFVTDAGDGGEQPPAYYRLNADLSGIPVQRAARYPCNLRTRAIRFNRDDQGRWIAGQDGFTQRMTEEIYAAARAAR